MPATTSAPDPKSIRLIHLSLLSGVLLFLTVALLVRSGAPLPDDSPLGTILLVAGAPILVLSQFLKARIPARRTAEPADAWWQAHFTRAIIVWSLIEGASLLGVVAFWITGDSTPLVLTAVGILLFLLTAPGRLAAE